jgi:putative flippase GtrA
MIARLAAHFLNRQFAGFLVVGGFAALLQWVSRFVFGQWMPYQASVVAAFMVGLTAGYILNVVFIFPHSQRSRGAQILLFSVFNLLGLPVVWGVSVVLGVMLLPHVMTRPLAEAVGNGIGILSPVAINFLLHKTFTFRVDPERPEPE